MREYNDLLKQGKWFEEYWTPYLEKKKGIKIHSCKTKFEQYNVGENYEGYEFKYDINFKKTENLFIEISEKTDPRNEEWIPSGILRNDNTIYYCIGDECSLFIFEKMELVRYYHSKKPNIIHGKMDSGGFTSEGFLLKDPEMWGMDCEIHTKKMRSEILNE